MNSEIDLANCRAILIGASLFPNDPTLPALPSVKTGILHLGAALCDPDMLALPESCVSIIIDEEHASVVETGVARIARDARDTLIVYYAGHGILGEEQNELMLAVRGTTQREGLYNGVSVTRLRRAIRESPAKRKILIVDCCFSGRLVDFMGDSTSIVKGQLDVLGTYAIASAPPNKPALAPEGARYTAFTGELLEVLRGGIDNGKDDLCLDDIFSTVRERLLEQAFPEPQRIAQREIGRLPIMKNRYRIGDGSRLLAELNDRLSAQDEIIDKLQHSLDDLESENARLRSEKAPTASGGKARGSGRPSISFSVYLWVLLLSPPILVFYLTTSGFRGSAKSAFDGLTCGDAGDRPLPRSPSTAVASHLRSAYSSPAQVTVTEWFICRPYDHVEHQR